MTIRVSVDKEKKTITVSDAGVGMTQDEVEKYINQIAFSGAEEFLDKFKDQSVQIIGHFGMGFYSSFMVLKKSNDKRRRDASDTWLCGIGLLRRRDFSPGHRR